jgi:orotate phosphoribosyltransferase
MADYAAEILLNLKAVALRTNPPFTYTSGALSPIYTDNRILLSYLKERKFIVDSLIGLIKENNIQFDGVAATATAGIPWGAWIASSLNKPLVYVRGKAKNYGKQLKVEGRIEKGKTYLVVEDLISTGGSSINTVNALRSEGAEAKHCIAIFTYSLKKSKTNFEKAGVKLHTLTNIANLLKVALEKKTISEMELKLIKAWRKDPDNWKPKE